MKPKHIKKETAKRLREGFHTDLMELIEEAIDLYGEKDFERGYHSFFADASVHASRIAELIGEAFITSDIPVVYKPKGSRVVFESNDLAKVIENYFNSLKTE